MCQTELETQLEYHSGSSQWGILVGMTGDQQSWHFS